MHDKRLNALDIPKDTVIYLNYEARGRWATRACCKNELASKLCWSFTFKYKNRELKWLIRWVSSPSLFTPTPCRRSYVFLTAAGKEVLVSVIWINFTEINPLSYVNLSKLAAHGCCIFYQRQFVLKTANAFSKHLVHLFISVEAPQDHMCLWQFMIIPLHIIYHPRPSFAFITPPHHYAFCGYWFSQVHSM